MSDLTLISENSDVITRFPGAVTVDERKGYCGYIV